MSSGEIKYDIYQLIQGGLIEELLHALQTQPELMNSVLANNLSVFETLLEAGYSKTALQVLDIDGFDVNHFSHHPLNAAISTGNVNLAYALLEKGSSPNYRPKNIGPALLLCLENEHFDLAKAMIDYGAEVDIRNQLGWTPLIWASIKGRFKAVQFLLEHGANVHICNNDGWNAVTGAYFKKRMNVVEVLLENGAVFSEKYAEAALLSAYEGGHLSAYMYLIKKMNTNPNVADENNITLLAKAVDRGDWAIVKLLIEQGADVNVVNKEGLPLVAVLAANGHKQLIDLFVQNGADINLPSSGGVTVIHEAARYNQEETLAYLIEQGANVNAQTAKGWTPLMLAAKNGYKSLVVTLLERGANSLLTNNEGWTAKGLARTAAPMDRTKYGTFMKDSAHKDIAELLNLSGHYL